MLSSKIIKFGEYFYRVYRFVSVEKLEIGNAYIFGGHSAKCDIVYKYVLPFRGRLPKHPDEPGIYLDSDDSMFVVQPSNSSERSLYSTGRIKELTPTNINSLNEYFRDVDTDDLKYGTNIFVPKITDADDVGIKAVRLALLAKRMHFNSYKNRFGKPWEASNTRKSLMCDNTLTFTKLVEYAEKFDFNFGIVIFDKQNAKDPISRDGKALMVFNDEEFPISDDNIIVVRTTDDILDDGEDSTTDEGDDTDDIDINDI